MRGDHGEYPSPQEAQGRLQVVRYEMDAVESCQAFIRAHQQIPVWIGKDRHYVVVGQTIFHPPLALLVLRKQQARIECHGRDGGSSSQEYTTYALSRPKHWLE